MISLPFSCIFFLSGRRFSSLSILPLWNDLHFRMNSAHSLSRNHFGWLWFIHINWILQRFFSLWPASQNPHRKLHHTKKKKKKAEWSEWIILDHTEGLRTNVSLLFAYLYLLAHLWAQKKQLSDSFNVICRL